MWQHNPPVTQGNQVLVGISIDCTELWQRSFEHFAVGELGSRLTLGSGVLLQGSETTRILRDLAYREHLNLDVFAVNQMQVLNEGGFATPAVCVIMADIKAQGALSRCRGFKCNDPLAHMCWLCGGNPTPHSYMPIRPHNIMHRTLQVADAFTTAFAIAQCQVVELPRMQWDNIQRTPGKHVAQAHCTVGKRRNYRVFACINAHICLPTLLSLPAQKGPFAHAKGCFCVLAQKTAGAQNVQFADAKGCFCVPVAKCAGAQREPFTYARMG